MWSVREVPLEALADAVTPRTAAVAWSAVQSSDGRVADTAAVVEAASRVGALTIMDTTQATGWLPLRLDALDAAVCSAYKWLCCPRGTAFMVASPRVLAGVRPQAASWFAADEMHAGYYGTPLRLANDARRFDMSPAWFAWMGAVSSLPTLAEIGMEAIHDHDVRLADGLRAGLGLAPAGSAIVSISGDGLEEALAGRGNQGGDARQRLPARLPPVQRRRGRRRRAGRLALSLKRSRTRRRSPPPRRPARRTVPRP